MIKMKTLGYALTLLVCCEFFSCYAQARQDGLSESLQQLSKQFPQMIHSSNKSRNYIEFCPDNTCQAFQSNREIKPDAIADFAYLYLYFFPTIICFQNGGNKRKHSSFQ
ncbi:hypothetical protein [Variovorax sp. PBL-E5]|uniref:hypothetical protein n=1 Tax=Variovorax sp. PBL-E5 TaxID=434014 RepID=UPI0013A531E1|nr:hypothetical protein [Variovorax sp. PBL-E5]